MMEPKAGTDRPLISYFHSNSVCWACGLSGAVVGQLYCRKCEFAGADNPWVSCLEPGCMTVRKRRFRGEQFFHCPAHSPGPVAA